jgi:hypothetical protein
MKLDPGMHIVMHLVFFGKTGVTIYSQESIYVTIFKNIAINNNNNNNNNNLAFCPKQVGVG